MKLMIASDIHGSNTYFSQLMDAYRREQPERLILLGDLLYHGPRNDLPDDYAPKKVMPLLNAIADQLLCVRGNCDAEVDQMVLDFPILSDMLMLLYKGRAVYFSHGHIYSPDCPPKLHPSDILITGHTHIPTWDERGENIFLNPGSVSLPKEDTPHGYMTLDDEGFLWKHLSGEVYHTLPIA